MKIAILLNEPYPYGMACTNRIHLYAKGLVELGNDVAIIVPKPTEKPDVIRNILNAGEHEGITFQYAYKTPVRSKSFIGRRVHDIVSFVNSLVILNNFKPEIILVTGDTFAYILLGKICSVLTKAKLIRERNEIPFFKLKSISRIKTLMLKTEYRLFDGLIVISEELKTFFSKDLSLKAKILEIPILINNKETRAVDNDLIKINPHLVYTGSLIDKKDGILNIIKAFAMILEEHPNSKLIMTGDVNKSTDKKKILRLIHELCIKDKIELTGYISKEKLNEITSTAIALILAKPDNRQNRYNMATKIGEYLLTGRPVVVSSVDSVCNYLSHRKNVFIVNPDEKSIAKEIKFILDNSEIATQVGLMGKKVALSAFDYQKQMLKMNIFFKTL